jgi:hypothetical protein
MLRFALIDVKQSCGHRYTGSRPALIETSNDTPEVAIFSPNDQASTPRRRIAAVPALTPARHFCCARKSVASASKRSMPCAGCGSAT